jgi:hypothetical protein
MSTKTYVNLTVEQARDLSKTLDDWATRVEKNATDNLPCAYAYVGVPGTDIRLRIGAPE